MEYVSQAGDLQVEELIISLISAHSPWREHYNCSIKGIEQLLCPLVILTSAHKQNRKFRKKLFFLLNPN